MGDLSSALATIGVFILGLVVVGTYIYFTSPDPEENAAKKSGE